MTTNIPPGLFGYPTETEVVLNGRTVKSLLDTGSTVSTISHRYYNDHLSDQPLHRINTLLDIECASGQQLPYEGYIEADIQLPHQKEFYPGIWLVVPDRNYHNHIPLLVGTNILHHIMDSLKDQHGNNYLQSANLTTP